MEFLKQVVHDCMTNTLEATWAEETPIEIKNTRCVSYSIEQRADFEAALGIDASKYVIMAGW